MDDMEAIPCEFCNRPISPEIYYVHIIVCGLPHIRTPDPDSEQQTTSTQNRPLPPPLPILEKTECPICYETIKRSCRELPCGHTFCSGCIMNWWKRQLNCPICKRNI